LLRRSRKNVEEGNPSGVRVGVHCVNHHLDLAALRCYAADLRPDIDAVAVDAIREEQCPACPPRYTAALDLLDTEEDEGELFCQCCGSAWSVEDANWVAVVGEDLRSTDRKVKIPVGSTIDSTWFSVVAFDPPDVMDSTLREHLEAFARKAKESGRETDAFVSTIVAGAVTSTREHLDISVELEWALSQSGFDAARQERWRNEVLDAFAAISDMLGPR
jgi:hypothetical protein